MTGRVVDFEALRSLIESGSSGLVDVQAELERAKAEIAWNARLIVQAPEAPSVVSIGTGDPERLLTYEQAAAFLEMSESYVETMVRQGKLAAVTLPATAKGSKERTGRARRIQLSVLKAFVSRGEA